MALQWDTLCPQRVHSTEDSPPVDARLGSHGLIDPIGRLIWAFGGGREWLDKAEQAAASGKITGVWLLDGDLTSPSGAATLVNRLQSAAREPLLLGVDAEAGLGSVVKGATRLPYPMGIGRTGNTALARAAGAVTAGEAAALGINVVAAPILDVNVSPENPIINIRSFGEDPELVGRMGVAFMEGVRGVGSPGRVVPIGKHFPGHGATTWDSHLELGVVDQPRERLDRVELAPFRTAIAAGMPLLMSAHVAYPALDPAGGPATLSQPIMTHLLRDQLGFKGVVVTDCMNMRGITSSCGPAEAAVRAVEAGCDLILADPWQEAYEGISRALDSGRLSQSRLIAAVLRVRRLKRGLFGENLARPAPIDIPAAGSNLMDGTHQAIAKRIAVGALSRRHDATIVAPGLIIATGIPSRSEFELTHTLGPTLDRLTRVGIECLVVSNAELAPRLDEIVRTAARAGSAAILYFNGVTSWEPEAVQASPGFVELSNRLALAGIPVTAVSLGSPYLLDELPGSVSTMCSYGDCPASVEAVVEALVPAAVAYSGAEAVSSFSISSAES